MNKIQKNSKRKLYTIGFNLESLTSLALKGDLQGDSQWY